MEKINLSQCLSFYQITITVSDWVVERGFWQIVAGEASQAVQRTQFRSFHGWCPLKEFRGKLSKISNILQVVEQPQMIEKQF